MKSALSVLLGLMVGTIGLDAFTGDPPLSRSERLELLEGVGMIALLTGMFAFSEIFADHQRSSINKTLLDRGDRQALDGVDAGPSYKGVIRATVLLGSGIGARSSACFRAWERGPASWFAYIQAKKQQSPPRRVRQGQAPKASPRPRLPTMRRSAVRSCRCSPSGFPARRRRQLCLGAFIIHGIQPGPNLFTQQSADLAHGPVLRLPFVHAGDVSSPGAWSRTSSRVR